MGSNLFDKFMGRADNQTGEKSNQEKIALHNLASDLGKNAAELKRQLESIQTDSTREITSNEAYFKQKRVFLEEDGAMNKQISFQIKKLVAALVAASFDEDYDKIDNNSLLTVGYPHYKNKTLVRKTELKFNLFDAAAILVKLVKQLGLSKDNLTLIFGKYLEGAKSDNGMDGINLHNSDVAADLLRKALKLFDQK